METAFKKRETSTTFEINGRNFVINSYDPMTGNYILAQIVTSVLPMGIGSMLASEVKHGSEMIPSKVSSDFKMMSKQDFVQLQIDVLSTVEELFPSGQKSPVVRENGTYGVENVSMLLLVKLFIASVAFNLKDFFAEFPSLENFISKQDTKSATMRT